MCFLTLDFELWENSWQMLQVCPLSVFTMYFLKSSGLCRSRTLPKMVMTIICKLMSWPVTITCCSCVVSYACLMPFGFQHWFHKYHRSRQNCWGNACSRCGFWHCTLIYEKSHGKYCMFCPFQFWWCTVWSPQETEILEKHTIYNLVITMQSNIGKSKILFSFRILLCCGP